MIILFSLAFLLAFSIPAYANPACAVCTVAVAASLEIARAMGVDDSVVGVWAGAFLALLGYWMILWFDKKKWNFHGRNFLLMVLSIGMIGFMYVSKIQYSPDVILIFYIDPFLFSVILGALTFILTSRFYQWMKAKNNGRAHFPFEKVVLPVAALAIWSVIFYYYPLCQKANELYDFGGM